MTGRAPKSPAMLAKRSATGAWAARRAMSCRGARLRARRDAFRVVGPVAVDADHAPLHAPLPTDHAAVFDDRVADRPPVPVGDQRPAAAKAAGNGPVRPGPVGHFADAVEGRDLQVGIPEPAFLGGE